MADNNGNSNGLINALLVPIVLALTVGGTSPWWWQYTPWSNSSVNPPDPPVNRTSITVSYLGDIYGCALPLTMRIGDREFIPRGNSFLIDGVKIGDQNYQINGTIQCPYFGACQAEGSGSINITPNKIYNVVWQNTHVGICKVTLQ